MHDRPGAVMLFAAGFGTRMAPLTDHRPKPLVQVAGRPLIDHARAMVRAAGITRVVANLHYRAELLQAHLAGSEVTTLIEAPEILDTGGGLRHALPLLGPGPVFTLNTDAVWTGANPLRALAKAWRPGQMGALLTLIQPETAIGHGGIGDFIAGPGGRLHRGPGLIYGGAQIVEPDALSGIPGPAFSLNAVWDRLAAAGRLYGVVHRGGWCDVGRPESIALAEAMLGGAGHV